MSTDKKTALTWMKRMGWAGFLFFLLKGLAWLAIGYGALDWLRQCK